MATIDDVSKRAGVSRSTVSRVVADNGYVSEEKRRVIQKAIDELGYRPNTLAQALRSNRSNMIGAVVVDIGTPYFANMVYGLQRATRKAGKALMVSSGYADQDEEARAIIELVDRSCDGILLYIERPLRPDVVEIIRAAHIPVVMIGRMGSEVARGSVTTVGGLPGVLASALGGVRPDAALRPADPAAMAGESARTASRVKASPAQVAFVNRMYPHAQAAQRATGLPAEFIVGQAALESGWGRAEMKHPDGRPAHNLFGIKAGAGWNGPTVEVLTTEYVDGEPRRMVEKFRAYDSYADAFVDWARLMKGSSRYGEVLRAGTSPEAFAAGLQRAGYATDPNYASKLERTIERTIELRRLRI